MLVRLVHRETGKVYTIDASQCTLHTPNGSIFAVAYERQGLQVYTDATRSDFDRTCNLLQLKDIKDVKADK